MHKEKTIRAANAHPVIKFPRELTRISQFIIIFSRAAVRIQFRVEREKSYSLRDRVYENYRRLLYFSSASALLLAASKYKDDFGGH